MGYACPVCETPQRDGEHLAHHLAFTAMLHGSDHEAWLDEHVPDWGDRDPAGLANAVTDHAEAAEYHEVFEDTTDRAPGRPDVGATDHPSAHDHAHGDHTDSRSLRGPDPSELDPEAANAVREARELTREMYTNGDDTTEADSTASDATEEEPTESDATEKEPTESDATDHNHSDP